MFTLNKEHVAYCDVDKTLVFPIRDYPSHPNKVTIGGNEWVVNEDIITELRDHHARGHGIVVWSKGGAHWAKQVVEALKLEWMVDAVMVKPTWIWDDIECSEWMGKRYYLTPDAKWKSSPSYLQLL